MLLLIAGFVLSLFGSLPPGLISLSVSQTSIHRGISAAMALALGAAMAEFFQAWAAVLFADWFVYVGWMRVEGWWQEGLFSTLIFSFGVSLGTIFALGLYAWLGQLIVKRSMDVARYANRVIGLIFIGLGLKSLFGLYF